MHKSALKKLLEPHLYSSLPNSEYNSYTISAEKLLTPTRFDLGVKLLYLDMLDKDVMFAKKMYEKNIRACGFGSVKEVGNDKKNSIEKFENDFIRTFNNIKENGFDNRLSILPISRNGSIANGAHRLSSAIKLEKKVACVELPIDDEVQDYKFFYNRKFSADELDIIASKIIEHSNNIYMAFIWPSAKGSDKEINKLIPSIIFKKKILLNFNGAHNLLSQIYSGEKWLGTIADNYAGAKTKLVECFKTFDPVRIIIFKENNPENVIRIKEKIRDIFNIGKHSVHITDTKEEAINAANMVLNENCIHFLNYGHPNKYENIHRNIERLTKLFHDNNIDSNDFIVDGGLVMSIYGLRENTDVDYLYAFDSIDDSQIDMESHDSELGYHQIKKYELIYNPTYFFIYKGIKFVSFKQLYNMKKNRNELKDNNDCNIMDALIEENKTKLLLNKVIQEILYLRLRTRKSIIDVTKFIGVYNLLKRIYKK